MVNDTRVYNVIKDKLRLSSGSTIRERIGDAFDLISYDRENNFKGDVDYAAVEHYLFSRWLIDWTGPAGYPLSSISILGYAAFKKLLPESEYLRFGKGPVTPTSAGDIKWSFKGLNDGLTDWKDMFFNRKVPQDPDQP